VLTAVTNILGDHVSCGTGYRGGRRVVRPSRPGVGDRPHHDPMPADVLLLVSTAVAVLSLVVAVLSLAVAVASARWSRRADRRAEGATATAVRGAAVSDLVDGLHRVRRLARQADVAPVTAQQVVEVMVDFEDRSHRHQAVLPTHLRAVGREVRAAMGNAFGSPAWAGLDARQASGDLAAFDHYWWEVTRSYLEHVDTCLQDWRVAPARRRPSELVHFYAWRQGEDASYLARA